MSASSVNSAPAAPAPEPAYRWVIVIASAIMMAGSLGLILNGLSVFLVPLEQEFGWGRGPASFINFAGLTGIAIGGIVMARVSEAIGIRRSVMLGAVTMGLSVLLASRADQLWHFYAIFFIGSFVGGGSLFAPMIANTSRWFKTGVGLAIGIVSGGQALGQGLVPYFGGMAISAIGWRDTFLWMGVLMLVTLPLLALLVSDVRVQFVCESQPVGHFPSDHHRIPHFVQVGSLVEIGDAFVVPASVSFVSGVERLMQVADEMAQEFQRDEFLFVARQRIAEKLGVVVDGVHHAGVGWAGRSVRAIGFAIAVAIQVERLGVVHHPVFL